MMKFILIFLALLVKQSTCGSAPSCPPCEERACQQPKNCQGGVVKDACGCCPVCAKVEGELCGGKWMVEGQCDVKLRCVPRDRHHRLPWPNVGHCEPTACANKKCGFRQQCTLNRRGQPHCVCPRNCRKRPVIPVCGYSNGKQYNNDCELYRQECKSLREIGLMHGPCKKCVHKRRVYNFGDIRPGDRPCEKCACHHGEWTCKVKKGCQVYSCSEVRARDGRKTSTCPPGYRCKVKIPGIPAQNIPAVAACIPMTFTRPPVKATRKRPVFKPPARCLIPSGKTGMCRARLVRWYFNPSRGKCLRFTYGGCGGNTNRFFTKLSCRAACKKGPNSSKVFVIPTKKPTTGTTKKQQICSLPQKVGPCRAAFRRWYYDAAKRRCMMFRFGGCGANANNFKTKRECNNVCPVRRGRVTVTQEIHTTLEMKEATAVSPTTPTEQETTSASMPSTKTPTASVSTTAMRKLGVSSRMAAKNEVGAMFACHCNECTRELTKNTCMTAFACFASVTFGLDGSHQRRYGCLDSLFSYLMSCRLPDTQTTRVKCCTGELCNKNLLTGSQKFQTKGLVADEPRPTTRASLATVVKVTPQTTAAKAEVCYDGHSMRSYGEGEEWKPNDCTVCKCRGGEPMCVATVCRHPDCRNPVRVEGLCCPACPRNESILSSETDDNIHALSGRKQETILVTINKAEERGVCEEEDSGELYLLGQTWKPDDCTHCECGRDGIVSCAVQSCEGQIPDCERPVREKGQCCPVCKEVEEKEDGKFCRDSKTGSFYRPGEMWQSDECTMCSCARQGQPQAICSSDMCKALSCPNPVRVKGRCCKVCPARVEQGCMFEGKKFLSGDYRLLADYCTLCECREGDWRCTNDKCQNTVQDPGKQ